MSTVLYIKANIKPEGQSRTFLIADGFIAAYRKIHPEDKIVTLDLYKEDIDFLSEEGIGMHKPDGEKDRKHPMLKYAYQFLEADKYVFAEPLWNLGVPAILKAYIDYIAAPGITFKYTQEGPVGLCRGKKALNITTRGGDYAQKPMSEMEMGDHYLRVILGFLGIHDFTTIAVNNLDVVGSDQDTILRIGLQEAEGMAEKF